MVGFLGRTILVHERDVARWELACPVEVECDARESLGAIEGDMRWISTIVPVGKLRVDGLKIGHDRQPSADSQRLVEPREFLARVLEMLDRFSACDEVEGALEYRRVVVKEWVIQMHLMTSVRQHLRERWRWSASVIQTDLLGRQDTQQRFRESAQKIAVTSVVDVVAVLVVTRAFFDRGWKVWVGEQCRLTTSAAPI